MIGRRRQAEEPLQQHMRPPSHGTGRGRGRHGSRPARASSTVTDEVIAGRRLLPGEDDVAPRRRVGGDRPRLAVGPAARLLPRQRPGQRRRLVDAEPKRIGRAGRDAPRRLRRVEVAVGAGVERRAVGVARPGRVARSARAISARDRNAG